MNKANLKSYAPQARKDFIAAVTARANLLGLAEKAGKLEVAVSQPQGDVTVIAGQAWPVKVHSQRQQLIARIQKDGFAQTMEAMAYTWFNRFAALRYMELHDYLGHGHRALSSAEGALPDILTHAADLAKSGELPGLKPALVAELKLAGNRDSELYRLLLVAQCNALSNIMPFLFERIDDETELLLPDNLLRTDSVIAKMIAAIDEEDWKEVEIIGWLYQFYISDKKEEVIGKVVKSEDIPAATQLFTPNWIVQYMVQNSVGHLWLMANPASTLSAQWPYFIKPANQTPEVQAQLDALIQTRMNADGGSLNPETITLLDPACGSGHILVEAYELLKVIYLERGYQPRAIPRLILEKNLYGLDIDDRAAQMASFALLMKARADDRRLFNEPIKLNVLVLNESKRMDADELARALQSVTGRSGSQSELTESGRAFGTDDLFSDTHPQRNFGEPAVADTESTLARPAIASLIEIFAHAKTFGSLIQIPQKLNMLLPAMASSLQLSLQRGDLYAKSAAQALLPLVEQAQVLGMQFDAVVANPPYMGSKAFTPLMKDWLNNAYKGDDKDLFSAFIARMLTLAKPHGYLGVMTSFVWMFITTFEQLRKTIVTEHTLNSLVQLHYDAFADAKAHVCTFVIQHERVKGHKSAFIRLSDFPGVENQGPRTLQAIRERECGWFFETSQDEFSRIPGSPIAYWIQNAQPFDGPRISDEFVSGGRTKTHGNEQYLRFWWEIEWLNETWAPYATGGEFRKYFGNLLQVVNWSDEARTFYESHGGLYPKKFWYKEGITWGKITSSRVSFRLKPSVAHYDSGAGAIFSSDFVCDRVLLGFLNSPIVNLYLKAMNPTVNTTVNDVLALPLPKKSAFPAVDVNVDKFVMRCQRDWDSYERSCDFQSIPFLPPGSESCSTLESSYRTWVTQNREIIAEMKKLEEENNRLFIDAYGLSDDLTAEVPIEQITLTVNPAYRYGCTLNEEELWARFRRSSMEEVISYSIGCMMGRYSLDVPGLIYARAGNINYDPNRYTTFPPDADGIVPITNELWYEDDAPSRIREFLLAVWGADSLAENMAWLAESLGTKASETADETIRRYLADKFYKDHLQTYKKRPIYWLFSSGKQGAFQALVYLHRYHEGTLARLRAEYVVPLTGKIQSRIDMLQKDAAAASSTSARNKLTKEVEKLKKKHVELLAYDEQLRHYADMRISLDLDEGVKVNYGKFGDLLAEVKAVTGGTSDD